ncbi:hypothetical protein GF380_06665 [Candidatus Uhrbacteria bacterium]|nr:hypothetical protein [Candidatus Uhrbacteria bacterium]
MAYQVHGYPLFSMPVVEEKGLARNQWFITRDHPGFGGSKVLFVSTYILQALRDGRYEDLPSSPPVDIDPPKTPGEVDESLRAAGYDPDEVVARMQARLKAMLDKYKERGGLFARLYFQHPEGGALRMRVPLARKEAVTEVMTGHGWMETDSAGYRKAQRKVARMDGE